MDRLGSKFGAHICAMILLGSVAMAAETILFEGPFEDKVAEGWRWVREDPGAWRMRDNALEIKVQPGNM